MLRSLSESSEVILSSSVNAWRRAADEQIEERAVEKYNSTKGPAPSEELKPSYTRDLGHGGKALQWFIERQPTVGSGPGQTSKSSVKSGQGV